MESPENSPGVVYFPQRRGCSPRPPTGPGSSQTLRDSVETTSLQLSLFKTCIFLWYGKVLDPSWEDLVENQTPKPHEELSSRSYPKVRPVPFSRRLHHSDTNVFLIECLKTL